MNRVIKQSPFSNLTIPATSFSKFILGRAATHQPRKIAYVDGHTRKALTFGGFLEAVDNLQRVLYHKYRVRQGDTVAIYALNSLDYPVIVHAFQALGTTVTLGNPRSSPEEIQSHLEHSGAKFVVIDKEFTVSLPREIPAIKNVFCSDLSEQSVTGSLQPLFAETLEYADKPLPEVNIDPKEDITMLLYSSGTTGEPKGACLTHQNLVANLLQTDKGLINPILSGPSVVNLALLPFYFIYGTMLMNHTLYSGQTSVVLNNFWLKSMLRALSELQVTYAGITPQILQTLATNPLVDKFPLKLSHIGTGGSPLNKYIAEKVESRLNCQVAQGFGMTEASPALLQPSGHAPVKHLSVGFPLPGTEIRIYDPEKDMDIDMPLSWGRLLVKGPQVMKRYHNDEAATRETLSEDGWLVTGDIAYFDQEGYFYIVDRESDIIHPNGTNPIAPSELERIIQQHPSVCDVAVVPTYSHNKQVPKAFVVLSDDDECTDTPNEILDFVNGQVPPEKQVHSVEVLSVLPRSHTGKIKRQDLAIREKVKASSTPEVYY